MEVCFICYTPSLAISHQAQKMKIFHGAFNLRRDILLPLPEALKILHLPASFNAIDGGRDDKKS
jgi:hypothetical protein